MKVGDNIDILRLPEHDYELNIYNIVQKYNENRKIKMALTKKEKAELKLTKKLLKLVNSKEEYELLLKDKKRLEKKQINRRVNSL